MMSTRTMNKKKWLQKIVNFNVVLKREIRKGKNKNTNKNKNRKKDRIDKK